MILYTKAGCPRLIPKQSTRQPSAFFQFSYVIQCTTCRPWRQKRRRKETCLDDLVLSEVKFVGAGFFSASGNQGVA